MIQNDIIPKKMEVNEIELILYPCVLFYEKGNQIIKNNNDKTINDFDVEDLSLSLLTK